MSVILVISLVQPVAAKDITVRINGITQEVETPPVNERGRLIMKADALAELLELNHKWDPLELVVVLSKGGTTAKFQNGHTGYIVNGKTTKYLPVMAAAKDMSLMLPLRQVCEVFGYKVEWNSKSQTASISAATSSTSLNKAARVNSLLVVPSSGAKRMSYEEALTIALEKNSDIKNLADSMAYANEKRRDFFKVYDSSMNNLSVLVENDFSPELTEWMRGITQVDSSMVTARLMEEIARATTEMMLKNYIAQIKFIEMDLVLAKKNHELAQTNWVNTTKKQTVGMASDSDLRIAKQDMDKAQLNLSSLQTALKNQRVGLNQLLRGNIDDPVDVIYTPTMTDVRVSLSSYALSKVDEDPKINMLAEELRIAQNNLSMFDETTGEASEKMSLQNEVSRAERAIADARNTMEQNIHSAYYKLQSLEGNEDSLELELTKANDTYNNALVTLEAGVTTSFEVSQSEIGILNAEINLEKNVYNYDLLYFQYQNPFLL